MESHIHGNVNVWFGGGDTHVPSGYDGLYPTKIKLMYQNVNEIYQTQWEGRVTLRP
jgi:hypothetical protein